jgi:hypothetical protein
MTSYHPTASHFCSQFETDAMTVFLFKIFISFENQIDEEDERKHDQAGVKEGQIGGGGWTRDLNRQFRLTRHRLGDVQEVFPIFLETGEEKNRVDPWLESIGVRRGVSKRVKDRRRPPTLRAGHPRKGPKAVSGVASPQSVEG